MIPFWSSLLLVYAGLFLTVLFACLFGINMYVWAKARINYKFIFEVRNIKANMEVGKLPVGINATETQTHSVHISIKTNA